jgi:hypothetical protein
VIAGVAVGVALRVFVFLSPISTLESDEAVVGLMALRTLDGDPSIFYWGALYGGSQEALATAAVFAVTGASTLVLKLVSLAIYVCAGVLVWLVGRRTVGEPAARVAATLFWVWPPFSVWWSTKSRGYFASGVLIGLAALLLVLRLRERDSKRDAALLGGVLGLGLWATLQSFLIAVPALAWLAWRRPSAYRLAAFAVPGFVVCASPWLAWNLRHGWNAVLPKSVAGSESTYVERFVDFFSTVLPMWLGLRAPYSHDWLLAPAFGWAVLVTALGAFAYVAYRSWARLLEPLVVVALAFPLLYAVSSFTFFTEEPRYLVFLGPIVALLLGAALAHGGVLVTVAGLAIASVLSLAGLVQLERQGLYKPLAPDLRAPNEFAPAIRVLEQNGVDRVLANYWIAYRLTFETRERIIASSSGHWRHQPYRELVRSEPLPGRVFVAGSKTEHALREQLLSGGYRRVVAGDYIVYVPRHRSG